MSDCETILPLVFPEKGKKREMLMVKFLDDFSRAIMLTCLTFCLK